MIWAILLAAGQGRRFGGDKLAAPMPDGTPMVVAAARQLMKALPDSTLAVIRPGAAEIAALLHAEGVRVIACQEAALGMGHSLSRGIAATPHADGWMVALGDMPLIDSSTVHVLAARLKAGALLATPCHRGRGGHPVAFARALRSELLHTCGDTGARDVLRRHARHLHRVAVDDPGIHIDIDTPGQLRSAMLNLPR